MKDADPATNALASLTILRRLINTLVANGVLSRDDAINIVKIAADDLSKDVRYVARTTHSFLREFSEEIEKE